MCVTTVYMSCLEGVLDQWEVHYQLVLCTFVICFVQHLIHLISWNVMTQSYRENGVSAGVFFLHFDHFNVSELKIRDLSQVLNCLISQFTNDLCQTYRLGTGLCGWCFGIPTQLRCASVQSRIYNTRVWHQGLPYFLGQETLAVTQVEPALRFPHWAGEFVLFVDVVWT